MKVGGGGRGGASASSRRAPRRRRSIAGCATRIRSRAVSRFPSATARAAARTPIRPGTATRAGTSRRTWVTSTRSGIHTGEDWNGRGGGDTDFGQPVMAVATGKVVVARRFPNPWGFVVVIEHIVLDGHEKRRVRSQYAHLSRIDVREGQIVHGRDAIGAIGKDPEGAYPAHLHLEIRSDLALGPTYWPSDHGRDGAWIRKHYLDPSAFIRAHRKLPDPAAEPQLVLVDQARYRMQVRVGGRVTREVEIGLGQAVGAEAARGRSADAEGDLLRRRQAEGQLRRRLRRVLRRLLDQGELPGARRRGVGRRERRRRRRGRGGDRRRLERAEADAAEHAARQRHRISRLGVRVEGPGRPRRAPVVRLRRHAQPRHRDLVRRGRARERWS